MSAETMAAGRELDALVAEKVMGLTVERAAPYGGRRMIHDTHGWMGLRHYSTLIEDAWLVVGRMQGQWRLVSVTWHPDDGLRDGEPRSGCWETTIYAHLGEGALYWKGDGATAAESICRAALSASAALTGDQGGRAG